MKIRVLGIVVLAVGLLCQPAWSADHRDGPAVQADPAADINDVYAWMSPDAERVYLVMTVYPFASEGTRFSDRVQYVFQTVSNQGIGMPFPVPPVNIIVEFDSAGEMWIWVGDDYVRSGDASDPAGLVSEDGQVRIFTGLRNDPFFFNLTGFAEVTGTVAQVAGDLTFDAAGCPLLDAETAGALVNQLQTEPDGGPAVDDFAGANILAIAISIDKSLLTQGGPALAVFGSTHQRPPLSNCLGDANNDGEVRVNEAIMVVNNILQGCQPRPAPALGVQIERMGRAAINTAAVDPFFIDPALHGMIQDSYNADADILQWVANWAGTIAGVIAVYDGLDVDCGNQLLAGLDAEPGRYSDFAALLATDALYVNTDSGTCEQYFGAELGITGDCGGRTPAYDTIDVTYSALVIGATSGATDGVPADPDGPPSATFPFLNEPTL